MPLIEIRHASTLDGATRREVVRAVTEAYSTASGTPESKVWVILVEVDRDSWGTGGTTLAAKDDADGAAS